jgi:hypothetical protein
MSENPQPTPPRTPEEGSSRTEYGQIRLSYEEMQHEIREEAIRLIKAVLSPIGPAESTAIAENTILPYINELVKKQVNRWGMAIASLTGGTTLLAIGASLVWIFFQFPNIALQKAMETLDARAITPVNKMNESLTEVLKKFGSIDAQSDYTSKRLEAIKIANEQASADLNKLSTEISSHQQSITSLSQKLQEIEQRTTGIDQTVKKFDETKQKADDLDGKVSKLDAQYKSAIERINFVNNLDWKPIEQRVHVLLGASKADEVITRSDEAYRGFKDIGPRVEKLEGNLNSQNTRLGEVTTSQEKTNKAAMDAVSNANTQATRIEEILKMINGADGNEKLRQDLNSMMSLVKVTGNCIRIADAQVCSGKGKATRQDGFPVQDRILRVDFETSFKEPPVITAVAVDVGSQGEQKVFFVHQLQASTNYSLLRARQEDVKDLAASEAEIDYLAAGKWR